MVLASRYKYFKFSTLGLKKCVHKITLHRMVLNRMAKIWRLHSIIRSYRYKIRGAHNDS